MTYKNNEVAVLHRIITSKQTYLLFFPDRSSRRDSVCRVQAHTAVGWSPPNLRQVQLQGDARRRRIPLLQGGHACRD